MAKRRARKKSSTPKARRSARRSSTRVVYVTNPAPKRKRRRSGKRPSAKTASRAARTLRRRRNPESKLTIKDGLIAVAAAAGAIGLVALAVEHEYIKPEWLDSPAKAVAVNGGIGAAGAYGAYKLTKSVPAALGIAAGLGGLAVYSALTADTAEASEDDDSASASISGNLPTALPADFTTGAVASQLGQNMGAVGIMGAVETMGGLYDGPYDDVAVDGGMFAD